MARISAKEREARIKKKKKGIERHRVKYPTPSQTIDVLTGDEEQNRKQKRRKRNRERVPNPAILDHSVASYDAQGSYGEPILVDK